MKRARTVNPAAKQPILNRQLPIFYAWNRASGGRPDDPEQVSEYRSLVGGLLTFSSWATSPVRASHHPDSDHVRCVGNCDFVRQVTADEETWARLQAS